MAKSYPYESCFAGLEVRPLVSEARDKFLALASLVEVQHFIPNIDTTVNIDVLPVAFNACVVNRVNKNKDVVDTATALAMYKQFIHKPINVEHNRQKVIGTILTAGFSKFGTDEPLTEEQVKTMTDPFNITLGGLVWRVVCPELSDAIEEASDPTSNKYLSVSASWELGFTGYRVALLEAGAKNLAEAKQIISDPDEVEKVKDKLTSLGGDGKINDLFAYRMPSFDVLPLGIGFTEKPAAEVKGVATKVEEHVGLEIPPAFDKKESSKTPEPQQANPPASTDSKKVGIVIPPAFSPKERKESHGEQSDQQSPKIISQLVKTNVKLGGNKTMKLTSIKDITDETLKECSASTIAEFISTELKKGSDEWVQEKNKLTTQLEQTQAASQKLQEEHTKLQDQMKQVQATIEALQKEKTEREQVEKFNVRMASITETYELDDEVKAAIVEDVKAIASDEDFAKWQKKASVLLKGFAKKAPPFKKEDKKEDKKEEKKDEGKCKGSEATASATVEAALENGTPEKGGPPNGATAEKKTLKDIAQAAFAKENFEIRV